MEIKQKSSNHRNLVLIGLIIGLFFSALEQTVVGTAMPTIISELNGFEIFAWVTTAYMISTTVVILIAGKLSDLFGRRILYVIGMMIFVVGSLLCATAQTMEQLVVYRGIQGIGGGMIMPLSQTIIGDIFTAEQRAKWQGIFGGLYAMSSVIGPFLGGMLVDNVSWHWIFLINAPFGIISAFLIMIGLKRESVTKQGDVHIDYLGIATLVPGLFLLLLGLTFGGEKFAWISNESFFIFGGSFVLLTAFILTERKAKEPILDLALFKNRVFLVTNVLVFLYGLGMFGGIVFVPMFMQAIVGVSPAMAGSTMMTLTIAIMFSSTVGGRLLLKFTYRSVLVIGMSLIAVSFYLLSTMTASMVEWTVHLYMIVMGIGMGLVVPTVMIAVQDQFPKERLGSVTAASTFFRAIGGTVGITILSAIMNQALKNNITDMLVKDVVQKNADVEATLATISTNPDHLFQVMINPFALKDVTKEVATQVVIAIKTAWSDSYSTMFLTGLIFICIGVLISMKVGSGRIKRDIQKS